MRHVSAPYKVRCSRTYVHEVVEGGTVVNAQFVMAVMVTAVMVGLNVDRVMPDNTFVTQ